MRFLTWAIFTAIVLISSIKAPACIWDAKTFEEEQKQHPTLADAILHPSQDKPDISGLKKHLSDLKASPRTNDPAWWNDLAGTYLRLAQPGDAIKILEPLTNRFANDYGVHANLGTAYHLLGRYAKAEREIRRDTEINTNAHFGLEKYHLALLQYLSRDKTYRLRHVYVDEFSIPFIQDEPAFFRPLHDYSEKLSLMHNIRAEVLKIDEAEVEKVMQSPPGSDQSYFFDMWLTSLTALDERPKYVAKWDLAADPKLDEGVIYMATLNPKEPACWVMLGVLAEYRKDYNLAKVAYEKAIQLGSPQKAIIRYQLGHLQEQLDQRVKHEEMIKGLKPGEVISQ